LLTRKQKLEKKENETESKKKKKKVLKYAKGEGKKGAHNSLSPESMFVVPWLFKNLFQKRKKSKTQ
jgi:hypothetical protein